MVYTDLHYFGSISYYKAFAAADLVVFDTTTPFSKMSFKNRMVIASAQGPLHLTIPIVGGRDQKTPMNEIRIAYDTPWKGQHFKSICNNYKRAPYFEYYIDSLQSLYQNEYVYLNDFLIASQEWIKKHLKARWTIESVAANKEEIIEKKWFDDSKPNNFQNATHSIQYQQVFEPTTGFVHNCCIIDLLFAMGGEQANAMLS